MKSLDRRRRSIVAILALAVALVFCVIIAKDPDIIILADSKFGVTPESVRERPGWEVITAVKEGAIFDIDDDLISRPGPRIVDGLEAVARIIHPELFK